MIESILSQRGARTGVKITVKAAIAALVLLLAAGLPQVVHAVAGAGGGVRWLPMYLPVLLGGCLLGVWWGLGVGLASPLLSFALTSLGGAPMPTAARLPFMMAELAVFAAVSGLFSRKIYENAWTAFPAVLLASVAGRATFVLLVAVFGRFTPFTVPMIWAQVQSGLVGLVAQAVIVPLVVMAIAISTKREKHDV